MQDKINVLIKIAKELNKHNINWAIGGSLLLYFEHKTDFFNDIDLMVFEKDAEKTKEILLSMGKLQPPNPNIKYKTKYFFEFVIDNVDIDVMAGFTIVKNGKSHLVSLEKYGVSSVDTIQGEKIPKQSLKDWKFFYELMDRPAKVKMITA